MVKRIVLVLALLFAASAGTARPAAADTERLIKYWGQDIVFYSQYHTSGFDSTCAPYSGSAAESHGYGWTTVALIDTGGSWRRWTRSSDSIVQVFTQPDSYAQAATWRKLALCKNSGSTTMSMSCYYWQWLSSQYQCF